MIKHSIFTFLFLSLLTTQIQAKSDKISIGVSATSGAAAGWWIYNKGVSNTVDPGIHLGYDRSHLSMILPVDFSVVLRKNNWRFGIVAGGTWLYEDRMIGSESSDNFGQRYDIAEKAVKFKKLGFVAAYHLIDKKRFSFSPQLTLGSFNIEALHPDKDNFGFKYFFKVEMESSITIVNSLEFLVLPFYEEMAILPKTETNAGMNHRVYSFGIVGGLRYWF